MKFILLLLSFILLSSSSFADSNGIWLNAQDVRGGVFGEDETNRDFSFIGLVNFHQRVNLNNDTYYKNTLLENVFVLENQTNSISTSMIQNFAVTGDKIANNSIGINKVILNDFDNRYYQKHEVYNKQESDSLFALQSELFTQDQADQRYILEGQINSISTDMILNGAITRSKIANLAIDRSKIEPGTIRLAQVDVNNFDARYVRHEQVYTRNEVDNLVSSSSGSPCPSRSNFRIAGTPGSPFGPAVISTSGGGNTCRFSVGNTEHSKNVVLLGGSSSHSGSVLLQCFNGEWNVLSYECSHDGGGVH